MKIEFRRFDDATELTADTSGLTAIPRSGEMVTLMGGTWMVQNVLYWHDEPKHGPRMNAKWVATVFVSEQRP